MKRGYKNFKLNKKVIVRKIVEDKNTTIKKPISKNILTEKIEKMPLNNRRKIRLCGSEKEMVGDNYNRHEIRIGTNVKNVKPKFLMKEKFIKKDVVDYDVVICIPSHNRYEKVKKLIDQFYNQPSSYSFKLILLNDGSNDDQYDDLIDKFPDMIYIKNKIPNGKIKHWYCYNQMWKNLKDFEFHAILQMDDDFILCDDFLNTIVDLYFEKKEEDNKILAIAPHLYSNKIYCESEYWWVEHNTFIDGIALFDGDVIKYMNYTMNSVNVNRVKREGSSAMAWAQLDVAMTNMGGHVFRTENSLVYHDDNGESKLHPNHRKSLTGRIYTQKFIGYVD